MHLMLSGLTFIHGLRLKSFFFHRASEILRKMFVFTTYKFAEKRVENLTDLMIH